MPEFFDATSEAMLHPELPASPFWREAKGVVWSVKKKKLFERLKNASSFSLAEHPTGVAKKVQPALFLCFVSFVRTKEMKEPSCNEKKRTSR